MLLSVDFPGGSLGKESACSAGDVGLILGLGTSPRGERGNPLQYSCLGIPWTKEPDRVQSRVAKSRTQAPEQAGKHVFICKSNNKTWPFS